MKLLKSEAEYFAYITEGEEEDALGFAFYRSRDEMRVYGPTAYPCYCYWRPVLEDDPEPAYLYEADVEVMLRELREPHD